MLGPYQPCKKQEVSHRDHTVSEVRSKMCCCRFSSEQLAKNVEFCKADSGEKPQEIVGFDGTVFIYILSIECRFLGAGSAQAESNTRNFPD